MVCDAFDAALRALLLAVGEFWPDEIEVKVPEAKERPRLRVA